MGRKSCLLPTRPIVWLCVLLSVPSVAFAGHYRLAHTFEVPSLSNGAAFGSALDLEGDLAVFSSGFHYGVADIFDNNQLHVFERESKGTWHLKDSVDLYTSSGVEIPIGHQLELNQGVAIVGTPTTIQSKPRDVRFVERHEGNWQITWSRHPNFPPFPPSPFKRHAGSMLGRVVSISGERAIVSDSRGSIADDGFARILERNDDGEWWEVANLDLPRSTGIGESRVISVAIDGNTAMMTSGGIPPSESEGLWVFERNDSGVWTQVDHIDTLPSANSNWVVNYVEIDGDLAIVRDIVAGATGIYERNADNQWSLSATLSLGVNDGSQGLVGRSFAIEDDLVAFTIVGDEGMPNFVELYRRHSFGDWRLFDSITAPDLNRKFGTSLALDGGRLLVGINNSTLEPDDPPGVAYLFVPVPEPTSIILASMAFAVLGSFTLAHRS